MKLTEGKEVILLQTLLTKGAMLVVDLHKKSVVGDWHVHMKLED